MNRLILVVFAGLLAGCAAVYDNGETLAAETTPVEIVETWEESQAEEISEIPEIEQAPPPQIFTTVQNIHQNSENFTFHRIVSEPIQPLGGTEGYLFAKYPVKIRIYGENGEFIQEISGLYQSTSPFTALGDDWMQLSFIDLNFDGYLDMRLFSVLESEREGTGWHYHWLWDSEIGQFVFNEQLTEFLNSVYISMDEEGETWSYFMPIRRYATVTAIVWHYRYENGEFVEFRREESQIIRPYDLMDIFLVIHVDSWLLSDAEDGGEPRINHITISEPMMWGYVEGFEPFIQEIRDIRTNVYLGDFRVPSGARYQFSTFDLDIAGFLDDEGLVMSLAVAAGERLCWVWEQGRGFVEWE
ncbi:MAG: hypothetical protein FWG65_00545 [Turicibacter sp.]|nr:hypothetical protein [Turicibacter sp.]